MEQWSPLTHFKIRLEESQSREITRWHEIRTQERETSRRGFYVLWRKRRMNEVLGRTDKESMQHVISSRRLDTAQWGLT